MEKLNCHDSCPFVANGLIRPCEADPCRYIASDPVVTSKANGAVVTVSSTVDTRSNHYTNVYAAGKRIGIVTHGHLRRENIAGYP